MAGKAPDLLGGLEETKAPDTGTLDLLSRITEDDGQAWYPWDQTEQPDALQGVVKSVSTIETDAKYSGTAEIVPFITFETPDGTLWSIRGYSKVTRGQLEACVQGGMKPGDHFAVKYLGEKQGKGVKPYHNVKAAFAPA